MITPTNCPTKQCTICRLPKDRIEFNKHGGHRDGLSSLCKDCTKAAARQRRIDCGALQKPVAVKTPKPQKVVAPVDPELVIDIPGIFEQQHRGKNYTSFNFTSLIDGTTFSFPSFREARQARAEMMSAFRQQAVFESVQRQSTGKLAVDDEDAT